MRLLRAAAGVRSLFFVRVSDGFKSSIRVLLFQQTNANVLVNQDIFGMFDLHLYLNQYLATHAITSRFQTQKLRVGSKGREKPSNPMYKL